MPQRKNRGKIIIDSIFGKRVIINNRVQPYRICNCILCELTEALSQRDCRKYFYKTVKGDMICLGCSRRIVAKMRLGLL